MDHTITLNLILFYSELGCSETQQSFALSICILYLISEKSCWKNWVRRIGFLVHFNCHAYSKLSSTQRFTHRDSISSLVCHKLLWERQCSYSKEKYKWYSKGPIFSEKYWYHFHCLKNVLRSILSFVFWIFPALGHCSAVRVSWL